MKHGKVVVWVVVEVQNVKTWSLDSKGDTLIHSCTECTGYW